jgi:murein DD-endopeptidase MepM/ murein hydrolase activator NlpD
MDKIYEVTGDEPSDLDQLPSILPVIGTISKHFSKDDHEGIDFAAPLNEPVYATAYGTVIFCGDHGDLGQTITLQHANGFSTSYSHLGSIYVHKGTAVKKGETIGAVGMTGNTSGAHLHYQIMRRGDPVNPEDFINK